MKKFFTRPYLMVLTLSLALIPSTISHGQSTFQFTRDLRLGQTHTDIRQLQIMLNQDPQTQIAQSGAGSPGNETNYFGGLTRAAVIRFQNKYRKEVLVPSGLSAGTGLVGPATRKKLNSMTGGTVVQQPQPMQTTQPTAQNNGSVTFRPANGSSQSASVATSQGLRLYSVFPYQVAPGGTITLRGTGMSPGTQLSFNNSNPVTVSATRSDQAQVTVPANLPAGRYTLSLSNPKGSSATQGFAIYLVVTPNPASAPTVKSISPSIISSLNTPITVTGSGFTSNNSIYTGFGKIDNVSSTNNGTTLIFTPSQLTEVSRLQNVLKEKPTNTMLYVDFYVMNENGMAQRPYRFNVQ